MMGTGISRNCPLPEGKNGRRIQTIINLSKFPHRQSRSLGLRTLFDDLMLFVAFRVSWGWGGGNSVLIICGHSFTVLFLLP